MAAVGGGGSVLQTAPHTLQPCQVPSYPDFPSGSLWFGLCPPPKKKVVAQFLVRLPLIDQKTKLPLYHFNWPRDKWGPGLIALLPHRAESSIAKCLQLCGSLSAGCVTAVG